MAKKVTAEMMKLVQHQLASAGGRHAPRNTITPHSVNGERSVDGRRKESGVTNEGNDEDHQGKCTDEESRLRAVILKNYTAHMPEFEIALHTGMRPSEQYGLVWSRVDVPRKLITSPKSKNGKRATSR